MFRKIRYILAYIMLIGGSHLAYTFYGNRKHLLYFAFSIILIIKALLEFLRYFTHKGINSYINKLLKKRSVVSSSMLILSFGMFFILSFYFYKYFISAPLVIEGWRALLTKAVEIVDLSAALIFFLIILVDYILLSGKKYQIEDEITESGKAGENLVYRELRALKKEEKGYLLYRNLLLLFQEFDFILAGENGIFNIEVKHYDGENTKIKIAEDGKWTKEKNKKIVEITNPEEQVERHRAVLNNIFGDKYPIIDFLVLSNDKNFIEGSNNTKLRLVKLSNLTNLIKNYKSETPLSKEDISSIKSLIKQNSESSRS
ncbi:MAG: nuclease-related domain-containing protein [Clostridiaceae bacterium]